MTLHLRRKFGTVRVLTSITRGRADDSEGDRSRGID